MAIGYLFIFIAIFLIHNTLGLLGVTLLVLSIFRLKVRPKRVISFLLGLILLGAQLIITHAFHTNNRAFYQTQAQQAHFAIYVPHKSISHSRIQQMEMAYDHNPPFIFLVSYSGGSLTSLYEQDLGNYNEVGPQMFFKEGSCVGTDERLQTIRADNQSLRKLYGQDYGDDHTDNDCHAIGQTNTGMRILVEGKPYAAQCPNSCNVVTKTGNTFIGLTISHYINPTELIAYFNSLEKTSAEKIPFTNETSLSIFPNVY